MVGIEEIANLARDLAKRRREAIALERLFGVVLVLVAAATGGAEVTEVPRARLTGDGRDDLSLLGSCTGVARWRQIEQLARLHRLEADEPIEQRVGQLADDIVVASLRRSFGERLARDERLDATPSAHGRGGQAHPVERDVLAIAAKSEPPKLSLGFLRSLRIGRAELVIERLADPGYPRLDRLLEAV
ncbi:MAG: hypothetical protein ACLQBL_06735 [Polyangiaceae bacterium]